MKKNLTVRLDDNYIKKAKIRAILENTNLSKVVEGFLKEYAAKADIEKVKRLNDS